MKDVSNYYALRDTCRSCGGRSLTEVYRTGAIPVAGIYYDRTADPVDIKAPMTLTCCDSCGLVQLQETISPNIYMDYSFVGNSADAYGAYLHSVAHDLAHRWGIANRKVYEVGASNGILLGFMAEIGSNDVSGVEPSRKLCDEATRRGIRIQQGYFGGDFVAKNGLGTFDCVIIRHVLEHIDDLSDMVASLRTIVKETGILVVEVPDVDKLVQGALFSNVFHEHLNYFSSRSLRNLLSQNGFENLDEREVNIHGGSLLCLYRTAKAAKSPESRGASSLTRMKTFFQSAGDYYSRVRHRVTGLCEAGKEVHGYGASHRTFVLLGNAGLKGSHIPIIYDSNQFLHHKRLNGFHSLVLPKEDIADNNPDALVIFAASYEDEIRTYLTERCHYRGEIISIKSGALSL